MNSVFLPFVRSYRVDLSIALLLMVLGGAIAWFGAVGVDPSILEENKSNVWFDADIPRVFDNMTNRAGDHYRTSVHPLFSVVAFAPTFALRSVLGLGEIDAVRLMIALAAGAWVGLFFLVLRASFLHRLDALLFTSLASSSGAAVFFGSIPETYMVGSITILLAFGLVGISQRRHVALPWYVAVTAATLSMTITNVAVGFLAAFRKLTGRQVAIVLSSSLVIVMALWGIQKAVFPTAGFFLAVQGEARFAAIPYVQRIGEVLRVFFLHSLILPPIQLLDGGGESGLRSLMSIQHVSGLSGSGTRLIGLASWVGLILMTVYGSLLRGLRTSLLFVLSLTIAFQLFLHFFYGKEVFLYSLHYLPVLILLVAIVSNSVQPQLARLLVCITIASAAVSNLSAFSFAKNLVEVQGTERQLVNSQIRLRPLDHWPRGSGHAVLGIPGSSEYAKSYLEPGGNFSPQFGSFGVSVWLLDGQDEVRQTSDSLDIGATTQKFSGFSGSALQKPGLTTLTGAYKSTWSVESAREWIGRFQWIQGPWAPSIAIRSVGPAGGPVFSLKREQDGILINERWRVDFSPKPEQLRIGSEGGVRLSGSIGSTDKIAHYDSSGWGVAIIRPSMAEEFTIRIRDLSESIPTRGVGEAALDLSTNFVELELPDPRFSESLFAQKAQLLMGLVGTETRPGDPINYPLAWQRDGAYVVVALARAGYIELSRQLAEQFAQVDFFGGFGAEADAPGLALWVLSEVSALSGDHNVAKQYWPAVRRKAAIIEDMINARADIHKDFLGPLVPRVAGQSWSQLSLISQPSDAGLIRGKMDNQQPQFHVNAVSYLGLMRAAQMAEVLGQNEDAQEWSEAANKLRLAWLEKFKESDRAIAAPTTFEAKVRAATKDLLGMTSRDYDNDRTWISPLWPSQIARDVVPQVEMELRSRWDSRRDADGSYVFRPLWTYFDIAEAHQWLELDDLPRLWKTIEWFWAHQATPGLFSWWEGDSEENGFGKWAGSRGWTNPKSVVPHYWTSAEMLLLQLEMLVSWRRDNGENVMIVGRGVPSEWLERPFVIRDLPVPGGSVTWSWNGRELLVDLKSSEQFSLLAGSAFPKSTVIRRMN